MPRSMSASNQSGNLLKWKEMQVRHESRSVAELGDHSANRLAGMPTSRRLHGFWARFVFDGCANRGLGAARFLAGQVRFPPEI